MKLRLIYWSFLAVVVLVVVPIVLVRTMVDHFRGRGSLRSGSGGILAGVGAALRELDHLVVRPSVEHQVETEQPVLKQDDSDGK